MPIEFVDADDVEKAPTADVVEVETIKAWLYEMVINNIGCGIDGDFSNACEEIIARLDGLRNFAKERGGRSETRSSMISEMPMNGALWRCLRRLRQA